MRYKKIMVYAVALLVVSLSFVFSQESFAGRNNDGGKKVKWIKSKYGLKALIELSKDRTKMEKDYKEETKSYEKVIEAIEDGDITQGLTGQDAVKRFGAPVVIIDENDRARWVYKRGDTSYFQDKKAYLYFDQGNTLDSWEDLSD